VFLDILAVFSLDFGQISFNLPFLPLTSRFMRFWLGHALKAMGEKVTYVFRLSGLSFFPAFPFSLFLFFLL